MSVTSAALKRRGTFHAGARDALAAARAGDRSAMVGIATQQVLFGLLPLAVTAYIVLMLMSQPHRFWVAIDFRNAYWVAGHRLLDGGNPYAWTAAEIRSGAAFVYPALSAVAFVPFALIPHVLASDIFMFVCMALGWVTLRVLDVRDWRVYSVLLMWTPFVAGWQTGNETLLLGLMIALAWRHRDRPWAAAVLTAAAISLKPFVWPLGLWLLATRRWRAFARTLICGLAFNLVAWSLVGFNQISTYLHASSLDTHYAWRGGYGVLALVGRLGGGYQLALLIMVLASATLMAGVLYLGVHRRRDAAALALTVVLMLIASPLVWSHYFVLVLVPLAVCRPRFGWLWLIPVLTWAGLPDVAVHTWQQLFAWSLAILMFAVLLRHDASGDGASLQASMQIGHLSASS